MPFYKITKLEAAKRQLETAIRLFFNDGDSISIHTLTAAAHNIFLDLARRETGKNKKFVIDDKLLECVRAEMKKEYINKIREPQNFFKHADKDPKKELRFNPDINNINLYCAVATYSQFTDHLSFWIKAYNIWFMVKNPELFNALCEPYLSNLKEASKEDFVNDKKLFIQLMHRNDSGYNT